MKTKLVYIMEKEEIEVLRKAKGIINLLYNAEVEFEDDAVEQDLLGELVDIEDMCIEGISLDELDKEEYDDYEEDEDDEEEPIVDFCEYCGCVIGEDEYEWVAADGSVCCCEECAVEYNKENFLEDDEEEDE